MGLLAEARFPSGRPQGTKSVSFTQELEDNSAPPKGRQACPFSGGSSACPKIRQACPLFTEQLGSSKDSPSVSYDEGSSARLETRQACPLPSVLRPSEFHRPSLLPLRVCADVWIQRDRSVLTAVVSEPVEAGSYGGIYQPHLATSFVTLETSIAPGLFDS